MTLHAADTGADWMSNNRKKKRTKNTTHNNGRILLFLRYFVLSAPMCTLRKRKRAVQYTQRHSDCIMKDSIAQALYFFLSFLSRTQPQWSFNACSAQMMFRFWFLGAFGHACHTYTRTHKRWLVVWKWAAVWTILTSFASFFVSWDSRQRANARKRGNDSSAFLSSVFDCFVAFAWYLFLKRKIIENRRLNLPPNKYVQWSVLFKCTCWCFLFW